MVSRQSSCVFDEQAQLVQFVALDDLLRRGAHGRQDLYKSHQAANFESSLPGTKLRQIHKGVVNMFNAVAELA